MHAQGNQLQPAQGMLEHRLLTAFAVDAVSLRKESASPALAPIRGAVLGSALGAVCWVLLISTILALV